MDAAQRMHCSLGLTGWTREKAAGLFLPLLLKFHCSAHGLALSFQCFVSLLFMYLACKLYKSLVHTHTHTLKTQEMC